MLTLPVLESYTKKIVESFKNFCRPTVKWRPLRIFTKCTEILFYLPIFFNIVNFKYVF